MCAHRSISVFLHVCTETQKCFSEANVEVMRNSLPQCGKGEGGGGRWRNRVTEK